MSLTYDDRKIKQCTFCKTWLSLDRVIEDPNIVPIGMSFERSSLTRNVFFFNHLIPECGTTFTIRVEEFDALLDDSRPTEIKAGTSTCEGHCSDSKDLGICHQDCYFAPYRQFLQKMIAVKRGQLPLESLSPTPDSPT